MGMTRGKSVLVTVESADMLANVLIAGELNSSTAHIAEEEIRSVIDKGHTALIVSLESVALITSAGLRILLVLAKEIKRARGCFVLYGPQPEVAEIFRMTGFDTILDIASTQSEAADIANAICIAQTMGPHGDTPAARLLH